MEIIENFILSYSLFICGILFTIASLVISETGRIFVGSIIYLIGDLIYLIYASFLENWFGIISLAIALFFGIRTLIKMHHGIFKKNLKDNKYNKVNIDYYKKF